mmetsp:Transcript_30094/g.39622  ORF Transcript_30094/g.39622 Transcript_30094/m.39622 type:complete len:432 (+) Transcript_30094:71-1366(+)
MSQLQLIMKNLPLLCKGISPLKTHFLFPKSRYRSVVCNHNAKRKVHHHSHFRHETGAELLEKIEQFASRNQTSVSLKTLLDTGKGILLSKSTPQEKIRQETVIQVATFLHRELPIRFAYRIKDLDNMTALNQMKSIQQVREWYVKSFQEIREFHSPETPEEEQQFAEILDRIYERHAPVLLTMAKGVYELRKEWSGKSKPFEEYEEIHNFLDAFYISRIGIRMLIGQYLALREEPIQGYIGMIGTETSPAQVARMAIEDATYVCNRQYGDAPEVSLHGKLDFTFPYVPQHLHYILMEILKNSMRATVDFHGVDEDMPPIRVVIADGESNEDVVIKISDEGGGIPRSIMTKIWSYLFTTADPAIQKGFVQMTDNEGDHDKGSPLAGLGYGLPISRSYARYFGGDLSVMSMEGYGTDAFIHLSRLGDHDEPLP